MMACDFSNVFSEEGFRDAVVRRAFLILFLSLLMMTTIEYWLLTPWKMRLRELFYPLKVTNLLASIIFSCSYRA